MRLDRRIVSPPFFRCLLAAALLCPIVAARADDDAAPDSSIRDWTLDDFNQRGHVVTPPAGEHSEQLKFWKWPGDNTLLDLRESRYFAHENGPFGTESLPEVEAWPTGADLREYRQCSSFEKYPISIRGRGSRNILVLGAHVVGVQPRELPWRIMKGFHDGDMKLTAKRFIEDGKTCGQLFKWSRWGGTVEVSNCIFRFDQMAASGPTPMGFPQGTYENVTLIWLGEGDYPKPLPEGIALSRDVKLWDNARAAWLRRHQVE